MREANLQCQRHFKRTGNEGPVRQLLEAKDEEKRPKEGRWLKLGKKDITDMNELEIDQLATTFRLQ